jgi:hypothetical protein
MSPSRAPSAAARDRAREARDASIGARVASRISDLDARTSRGVSSASSVNGLGLFSVATPHAPRTRAMSPSKLRVNTQRLHRAYSSGDLGRRPKFATNVAVLLLTNVGLLSFFLGGVYFVLSGWDQTATLCVVGYVCCGLALAIPSMTFSKSLDDEKVACDDDEAKRDEDSRVLYRVFAGVLNVAGLILGILGSLLYSPGFCKWATSGRFDPYVNDADFETLTDRANVIWAISFLLFPIGSGLFLYDRKRTLEKRAALKQRRAPGYFSQELYLYTWIEIALVIFAVGGMLFCFDDNEGLLVGSLVLFFIGGGIKAGLMFHELRMFFGGTCDAMREGHDSDDSDERSPLIGDRDNMSDTSSLLGDA